MTEIKDRKNAARRAVGAGAMMLAAAAMVLPTIAPAQDRGERDRRGREDGAQNYQARGARGQDIRQAEPQAQQQQAQQQVQQQQAQVQQQSRQARDYAERAGRGPEAQTGRPVRADGYRGAGRGPGQNMGAPEQTQAWRENRPGNGRGPVPNAGNVPEPQREAWRGDRDGRRQQQPWRNRQDDRRGEPQGNRGDWQNDRNGWRSGNRDGWRDNQRDNGRDDWRNNGRDNGRYDARNDRSWDRSWRSNNRYDWSSYRSRNRDAYRIGRYNSPYRNYSYSRLGIGFSLGSLFYGQQYWINDPWSYRLPEVYGPYRWVRYYDDVVLVDTYTGEVVDVIYDFFW